MRNRRAVAAAISSSVLFCVAMIACSSDPEKSTFNDTQPDASFDTGTLFNPDATQTQTPDAPVSCQPSLPTNFDPKWNPPTPQTVCTQDNVSAYFDHCIALDANQKSQFNTATCTDWLAQNGACGKCIEDPVNNSGPIQEFNNRGYFGLNNAGCIAIEQNNSAEGSCGQTYDAATQCRRDSCNGCFSVAGATFNDFIACQALADTTGCTEFNQKSVGPCTGYQTAGADGGVPQCFPLTGDAGDETSSSTSFYMRLIGIFCTAK